MELNQMKFLKILVALMAIALTAQTTLCQTVTAQIVNGIRNAALYSGSDIGAQINNAMGSGGTVMIPDGTYSFSTTISVVTPTVSGLTVDCGSNHTTLNYTGSGDAVYVSSTSGPSPSALIVFRNCTFNGSGATSTANGVHVQNASGVVLENCIVENFKHYGVYDQGAIDSLYENVNALSNGVNLLNTPDASSGTSTNGMRWTGGSLQYATVTNYWEMPASAGRDQLNIVQTTMELTASQNIPQAIVEACDSCTIRDSYIEYLGASSGAAFPDVVIGNASGICGGTGTSQTVKHMRIENNYTIFPSGSNGYCVVNAQEVTFEDNNEQGIPDYFVIFPSSPTIGISNVTLIGGIWNWSVAATNDGSTYLYTFLPPA